MENDWLKKNTLYTLRAKIMKIDSYDNVFFTILHENIAKP